MLSKLIFSFILLVSLFSHDVARAQKSEAICGKWERDAKDLVIKVYTVNNKFMAEIVWFKNTTKKAMGEWEDVKNPDEKLRNRKLLGMNVLTDLEYVPASNSWEHGLIYDSTSGRKWNSAAYIDKEGQLEVRGYWHFKFIGKTLTFNRVK